MENVFSLLCRNCLLISHCHSCLTFCATTTRNVLTLKKAETVGQIRVTVGQIRASDVDLNGILLKGLFVSLTTRTLQEQRSRDDEDGQ